MRIVSCLHRVARRVRRPAARARVAVGCLTLLAAGLPLALGQPAEAGSPATTTTTTTTTAAPTTTTTSEPTTTTVEPGTTTSVGSTTTTTAGPIPTAGPTATASPTSPTPTTVAPTSTTTIAPPPTTPSTTATTATTVAPTTTTTAPTTTTVAPAGPSVAITTVATVSGFATAGDVVTWSVVATNDGGVPLTRVGIADAAATLGSCSPALPVAVLAPGASVRCIASRVVTQADVDAGFYDNTAAALGAAPGGAIVSAVSPAVRVTATVDAAISVTKTPTVTSFAAVGDPIGYAVVVRNTGNVTVTGVSVGVPDRPPASGSPASGATGCVAAGTAAALAPGAAMSCTATHVATQADLDAGQWVQPASATATAPKGRFLRAASPLVVVRAAQTTVLATALSTTAATYQRVGDLVAYAVRTTNTGNVTLTNVAVTTSGASMLGCSPALPVAALAPNAQIACLAAHTVTQADIDAGHYDNTAAATAIDGGGGPVSAGSAVLTVPATHAGHLSVATRTTASSYGAVGATIGYTIDVVNDGNVTVSGLTVAVPGAIVDGCTPALPLAALAPDDSVVCTATHTVTQADLDVGRYDQPAEARATASGSGALGTPPAIVGTASPVSVPASRSPHVVVTMAATIPSFSFVGQPVTFLTTVLNDGNMTLSNLTTVVRNATIDACTPGLPAAIGSGQTLLCTATHVVTQADLDRGWVGSSASLAGRDPTGAPVAATTADVTVPATNGAALTVDATSATAEVGAVGELVRYDITVRNTGNVVLNGVRVTDPKVRVGSCTPAIPVASLPSGETIRCTATYAVTQADLDAGRVLGSVAAIGAAPGQPAVTVLSAAVTTPARQAPNLVLAKTARLHDDNANRVGNLGEAITYTLTASNQGNVTLHGVAILDGMFATLACDRPEPADLAPGTSYSCRGTHTIVPADVVNGTVLNTATATGSSQCQPGVVCSATVSDHAEANVEATVRSLPFTGADVGRQAVLAAALTVLGLFVLLAPSARRLGATRRRRPV